MNHDERDDAGHDVGYGSCEAVSRPTMRFVPVKTPDEQAACMVLKTRELFVRQRSQTANAMRAHMAELGIITATGMTSIAKYILILRDLEDPRVPMAARAATLEMVEQIETLTARIEKFDTKIIATVKADETTRRLTSIPGVGPIIAATVRATIQDPSAFRMGKQAFSPSRQRIARKRRSSVISSAMNETR